MQWCSKKSHVLFSRRLHFLQRTWHRLQNLSKFFSQSVTTEKADELLSSSGRKNVLRKLLRIPYRRLKAGIFCALTLCLFVAGVLSGMHEVRTFAPCKAILFDMFAFFSLLENYFGFRTTNVKGKKDHSVSPRWNKRFWTFLKSRVFFWLCIR